MIFRITTNGREFRIEKLCNFLWFKWWSPRTDWWGDDLLFETREAAQEIIDEWNAQLKAEAHGWKDLGLGE